jgi:hypothetical protein
LAPDAQDLASFLSLSLCVRHTGSKKDNRQIASQKKKSGLRFFVPCNMCQVYRQTDRQNTEDILDAQDRQKKRQDRQISRHTEEGQTGEIEKQTDGRVGLTDIQTREALL